MKQTHTYLLLFLAFVLSSCLRSVDLTPAIYYEASTRHHELADSKVAASNDEWMSLIEEFKQVVAADPHGEWADDAQYAIASCRMWLSKDTDPASIQHTIDALEKLLEDYPDSPLAAEAHYWLGHCHSQQSDDNLATVSYQTAINDHFDQPISEHAQLQLAQIYVKQNHLPAAIAVYQSLAKRSEDSQIIAQAEEQVQALQSKDTSPDPSHVSTDGITSLAPMDIPSEHISFATPPTEELRTKDVKTTTTVLEKTDPMVGIVSPPNPHTVLSEEPEIVDLPSAESTPTPTIDKNKPTQPQDDETRAWNKRIQTDNSDAESGIHLSLSRQLGLGVKTIVIDPGHGGEDPGGMSDSWTEEKAVVLDLSIVLQDLLVERGYRVRLTRETDIYLPLQERTEFATTQGADLFISIHANAAANPEASGIETYYLALASDESAQTTAARENIGAGYGIKELDTLMAQILRESKSMESRRLAEFLQEELISTTKAISRGVKHAPFVVLIGTKVPAVLVEVGFLSHSTEVEKLTTKAYQRTLAEAIVRGIEQYVSSIPVTTAKADRQIGE